MSRRLNSPVNAEILTERQMYQMSSAGLRWYARDGEPGVTLQVWIGNGWSDIPAVMSQGAKNVGGPQSTAKAVQQRRERVK